MPITINNFAGIAPKIYDRKAKDNMAEIAENVNLDHGSLKPIREPKKVSDAVGGSIFVEDCCYITGDCDTSFTQFGFGCDEIIVATGLYDEPVYTRSKDCPPVWKPLGYPCDLPKPKARQTTAIEKDLSLEHRSYYYTLVNDMGWESQPSYPSDYIEANTGEPVQVTGIAPPTDDYVKINIYRSSNQMDYGVKQQEVVESTFLHVGTIGKGETSFIDNILVAGDANVTEQYAEPPKDLYSIDSWREGRLVGLSGNTVVMSERNRPYAWNSRYTVYIDKATPKRLVATERKAYVLTDGKPVVLELRGECDDKQPPLAVNDTLEPMPIISQRSAVAYGGGVVYASNAGLIMLNGVVSQVLTQDYYSHEQWQEIHPHTMVGEIHEGYYYGVTDNTTIRYRLPDNIYAKDAATILTTLSLKPIAMHVSNQGRFYMAFDDSDRSGIYEWAAGDDYLTMHWRSKVSVNKAITKFSSYKVVAEGSGNTIAHIVDTRVIQEYQHKHNDPVRLPVGYRGLNWQVDIKGKSEVLEYSLGEGIRDLALI